MRIHSAVHGHSGITIAGDKCTDGPRSKYLTKRTRRSASSPWHSSGLSGGICAVRHPHAPLSAYHNFLRHRKQNASNGFVKKLPRHQLLGEARPGREDVEPSLPEATYNVADSGKNLKRSQAAASRVAGLRVELEVAGKAVQGFTGRRSGDASLTRSTLSTSNTEDLGTEACSPLLDLQRQES